MSQVCNASCMTTRLVYKTTIRAEQDRPNSTNSRWGLDDLAEKCTRCNCLKTWAADDPRNRQTPSENENMRDFLCTPSCFWGPLVRRRGTRPFASGRRIPHKVGHLAASSDPSIATYMLHYPSRDPAATAPRAPPPAPTRYTTEFIDDEDVYNGEAGAQLASDLAGWTAAAVISVVLAHGDKLIGKNF